MSEGLSGINCASHSHLPLLPLKVEAPALSGHRPQETINDNLKMASMLVESFNAYIAETRDALIQECGTADQRLFVDMVIGWLGRLVRDPGQRYAFDLGPLVSLLGYSGEAWTQRHSALRLARTAGILIIQDGRPMDGNKLLHEGMLLKTLATL